MTTTIKTDFIIFEMLTASTGSHFLDSGGSGGRHWERNQKKSFDEFLKSVNQTDLKVNEDNMNLSLNTILYGPPGTGKTYKLKNGNYLDIRGKTKVPEPVKKSWMEQLWRD